MLTSRAVEAPWWKHIRRDRISSSCCPSPSQRYQVRISYLLPRRNVDESCTAFVVLLRTLVRSLIIRRPSYDDYLMLLALVFTIGYMVEILIGRANHVGFPASLLTVENKVKLLKDALAIEVTYWIILGFIKISILCMYLRFGMFTGWDLSRAHELTFTTA